MPNKDKKLSQREITKAKLKNATKVEDIFANAHKQLNDEKVPHIILVSFNDSKTGSAGYGKPEDLAKILAIAIDENKSLEDVIMLALILKAKLDNDNKNNKE